MKFRTKQKTVEAIQWTGANSVEVMAFTHPSEPSYMYGFKNADDIIALYTTQGFLAARKGDWFLKNENGEFDICSAKKFAETYEKDEE